MVTISSSFIGDFKLGDNIVHNLEIMGLLYRQYEIANQQEKRLLCKPIIVLLVSIVDAVLYDFHTRIRYFTNEGVQNVAESSLKAIREMKGIDKLDKYIRTAENHTLFGPKNSVLYTELDDLRKLRNRIHIQNTKKEFELDEYKAFNDGRKQLAERVLEEILQTMSDKYSRKHNYVRDFELPWDSYFTNETD